MGKKRIFIGLFALLMVLMVGCQSAADQLPDALEHIVLAQDKATEYCVVSYLEDSQPVKLFLADLLIKTRAKFTLTNTPKGKTIYIGTAAELDGKGGTDPSLTYTKYELRMDGDDLYISLAEEATVKEVLASVEEAVQKLEDGSFGFSKDILGIQDASPISEVIPVFEIASGAKDAPHDCGNGNYMVRYHTLQNADVGPALAGYVQKLQQEGFALYQENSIGDNLFLTYAKGDTMVHCNYFSAMREFRVVYGPMTARFQNTPVENYEKLVTPSVSIIRGTENVLCMVVQVADGSFFVIDGGWDSSGWQTKTLNANESNERTVRYYRDAEGDMLTLYNFLKDNTPGEGKPQVTWMITHADPDHILMPTRFIREYKHLFDLNMVIYNFPNLYNVGLGESAGSTNDPSTMTAYGERFLEAVNESFPQAQHYVYHTGEKLYIPGGDLEFLMTPGEDYYPHPLPWMNHTSGIWRFTIEGKTVMIAGDAETGLNRQIAGLFGDYLKSDVFQLNHHGANGGTLGFYKLVDPTVCFWACQQYHLDYDNRHLGLKASYDFNKFIRTSENVIANYSNTETHTILLPSLEEKK